MFGLRTSKNAEPAAEPQGGALDRIGRRVTAEGRPDTPAGSNHADRQGRLAAAAANLTDVLAPRLRELVARMRAVLRRAPPQEDAPAGGDVLEVGDVRLDPERHEVSVRAVPVLLPSVRNPGRTRKHWRSPGQSPATYRSHGAS